MKYKATIGLEIHAELKTHTKMFCNSKNDADEKRPNVNICPVCMGHPGTLPVINKEAVVHVLRVGTALGSELADFTEFDRKNYFYPDIPKGYQISQYQYPLVSGGSLVGVDITRVHLEEDTARSLHGRGDYSLVDFNRAGLPLMELVTEPVVRDAQQAVRFARELQLLLRYLGAGDANMEKGEMRVEANVSISKTDEFGTKVEVKNLNSFRAVEGAIAYEIARQAEVLDGGGEVVQETRGWDENKQATFSQRKKESSHDYRYFPDPDLPKLKLSEVKEFNNIHKGLPELPWERRARIEREYGLKGETVEMFVVDKALGDFFIEAVSILPKESEYVQLAANYVTSDLVGLRKDGTGGALEHLSAESFAKLIKMTKKGDLSSRGAKDTLAIMYSKGGDAEKVAKESGLIQQSDAGELRVIAKEIIGEHESVANEYKGGKDSALQFLVGQGMKATKGAANPKVLKDLFTELLGGS